MDYCSGKSGSLLQQAVRKGALSNDTLRGVDALHNPSPSARSSLRRWINKEAHIHIYIYPCSKKITTVKNNPKHPNVTRKLYCRTTQVINKMVQSTHTKLYGECFYHATCA